MEKLYCAECGAELSPSNTIMLDTGEMICSNCLHSFGKFEHCGNCGRWFRRENGGCSRCRTTVYDRVINSYSTKPTPIFHNKKGTGYNGNRFYGFEIELNNTTPSYAYYTLEDMYKDKRIYNKSDSSISGGVEIVTNPCDYTSAKKLLDDMGKLLSTLDSKLTDVGAGIHIHVNRKSIDPIDIYKLFYLFDTKTANNRIENMFMYLVGRHKTSTVYSTVKDGYCRLGKGKVSELVYNKVNNERHSAINLRNSETIEFRMFRSTNDIETIKGYLDFVNMSIDFCHNNPLNKISLNNLILYIKANTKSEVLLKRIKNFERYRGKLEPKDNRYSFDMEILRGIKYDKYKDICAEYSILQAHALS